MVKPVARVLNIGNGEKLTIFRECGKTIAKALKGENWTIHLKNTENFTAVM